ncbi:MAG: 50S ribosomal protein L24, partial [Actinomycetota bacterium]|nr:50S ribosomal protein L24 [Actinomycetota bacterium]
VRHQRPLRANEQGGRIDKDMPIDISNVMLVHKGKPVRVGYRTESDGSKVRIARPSGEVIK